MKPINYIFINSLCVLQYDVRSYVLDNNNNSKHNSKQCGILNNIHIPPQIQCVILMKP